MPLLVYAGAIAPAIPRASALFLFPGLSPFFYSQGCRPFFIPRAVALFLFPGLSPRVDRWRPFRPYYMAPSCFRYFSELALVPSVGFKVSDFLKHLIAS